MLMADSYARNVKMLLCPTEIGTGKTPNTDTNSPLFCRTPRRAVT